MDKKNKEYWDNFYIKNSVIEEETPFARYTLDYIKSNMDNESVSILDIACGNGRDSMFFGRNGLDITGIDLSIDINDAQFNFIRCDLFTHDYSDYNIFYLRFLVHTLSETELEKLISKFKEMKNITIFIETRSTNGVTDVDKSETFFKSSVGSEHFRMLYSKEYLDNKLKKHFNIVKSEEGKYSKFGSDDPYCLRYILKI